MQSSEVATSIDGRRGSSYIEPKNLMTIPMKLEKTLDKEVIIQMHEFSKNISLFKKAALNVFVKTLKEADVQHLRRQFEIMDVDHTGIIEVDELRQAIKQLKVDIPDDEVLQIIDHVNFRSHGEINYTEFLAATISAQEILTQQRLYALFKELDHQNIDILTEQNLKESFRRMGKEFSEEELQQMMSESGVDNADGIGFEDFKRIFQSETTSQ